MTDEELKVNLMKEGFIDVGNDCLDYILDLQGNKARYRAKHKDFLLFFDNSLDEMTQHTYLTILQVKWAKATGDVLNEEETKN